MYCWMTDKGCRNRSDEIRMGPQRRQTAFEVRKLLTEQPRTPPLHVLDQLIHPELWIDFADNVNMIWHDFKLNQFAVQFSGGGRNDLLQAGIHRIDPYPSSTLRAKYPMVLARIDDVVIPLEGPIFRHNKMIQHEAI